MPCVFLSRPSSVLPCSSRHAYSAQAFPENFLISRMIKWKRPYTWYQSDMGWVLLYTHSRSFSTQIVVLCISVHPISKRGSLVHLLTKKWFPGTLLGTMRLIDNINLKKKFNCCSSCWGYSLINTLKLKKKEYSGSEYIMAHTGPRELDGHPLGGCGSGFGLVPGCTTLSVRVQANI